MPPWTLQSDRRVGREIEGPTDQISLFCSIRFSFRWDSLKYKGAPINTQPILLSLEAQHSNNNCSLFYFFVKPRLKAACYRRMILWPTDDKKILLQKIKRTDFGAENQKTLWTHLHIHTAFIQRKRGPSSINTPQLLQLFSNLPFSL